MIADRKAEKRLRQLSRIVQKELALLASALETGHAFVPVLAATARRLTAD